MDEKKTKETAIEVARKLSSPTIATVLAAAILGVNVNDAALVGALASGGVNVIVETIAQSVVRRRLRAGEAWWRVILEDETRSPESVAEQVAAKMSSDENVTDVVVRSIRDLLNVTDEAAIPSLARLAKEYIGTSKAADRFFRGASRMLCDCEAEDLDALRVLLNRAKLHVGENRSVTVGAVSADRGLRVFLRASNEGMKPEYYGRLPKDFDAHRVCYLLRTHGLAVDANISGGNGIKLTPETIDRLIPLLRPVEPS